MRAGSTTRILKHTVILGLILVTLGVSMPLLSQVTPQSADRPRGGLFSEEGLSGQALSLGWFVLGLYVLAGLIFAGACAHQAVHKALSPIPWFFMGFFLNVVGYLLLLTRERGDWHEFPAGIPCGLRKVPRTFYSEECPGCGYHNHPAGHYCPGCGNEMEPAFESEATRWRKSRFN